MESKPRQGWGRIEIRVGTSSHLVQCLTIQGERLPHMLQAVVQGVSGLVQGGWFKGWEW